LRHVSTLANVSDFFFLTIANQKTTSCNTPL
jgi:hypothetical protein